MFVELEESQGQQAELCDELNKRTGFPLQCVVLAVVAEGISLGGGGRWGLSSP